jgi:hypothetical protein
MHAEHNHAPREAQRTNTGASGAARERRGASFVIARSAARPRRTLKKATRLLG